MSLVTDAARKAALKAAYAQAPPISAPITVIDPIKSAIAKARIEAAVAATSTKAQPTVLTEAIKAAYSVPRPYTMAAVEAAILPPLSEVESLWP